MGEKIESQKLRYDDLSSIDVLHLFWFYKIERKGSEDYSSFKLNQTLVDEYNEYLEKWDKNYKFNRKRVLWDEDRDETKYFTEKVQDGGTFEDWVDNTFAEHGLNLGMYNSESGQYNGENELGLEIKKDSKYSDTGNIYIEFQERMRKNQRWVNSGILKNDNTRYWIIGTPEKYFIYRKKHLVELYEMFSKEYEKNKTKIYKGISYAHEIEHGTSKGILIHGDYIFKYALSDNINDLFKLYKRPVYGVTTRTNEKYYHLDQNCKFIGNNADVKYFSTEAQAIHEGYRNCLLCVDE